MARPRALSITKLEADAINKIIAELKYLEKKPRKHKEKIKELADIIAHHNSYYSSTLSLADAAITREEETLLKEAEQSQNKLREIGKRQLPFRFLMNDQTATWKTLDEMKKVNNITYTRADLKDLSDEDKLFFQQRGVKSMPVVSTDKIANKRFKIYLRETQHVDDHIKKQAAEIEAARTRDLKKELKTLHSDNRRVAATEAHATKPKPKAFYTASNIRMTVFHKANQSQSRSADSTTRLIKHNSIGVPK